MGRARVFYHRDLDKAEGFVQETPLELKVSSDSCSRFPLAAVACQGAGNAPIGSGVMCKLTPGMLWTWKMVGSGDLSAGTSDVEGIIEKRRSEVATQS